MKDTIYYIYQKYFQRNILQSFQTVVFLHNTFSAEYNIQYKQIVPN